MSGDAPTVQHARFVDDDELDEAIAFQITVLHGPDRERTIVVEASSPGPTWVGTSESCGLRLSDRTVSRRHAALDVAGRQLRLRDLDSTNGTWLGSVGLRDAVLGGGEVVTLGRDTQVQITRLEPRTAEPIPDGDSFGRYIGASHEMRRRYPLFRKVAASTIPVVIEGETGTGKEVLAEAIHEMSPRAQQPFVVFDCTAVPASLVESELFGVERGAFTGASASRPGIVEQAAGGTLLIDEIGDLDLHLQPKLLRVLERSEVRRVGGTKATTIDVRIIAATRRDLDRQVQDGLFRDDLFHRLAVGRIELPPLRQRRGDVLVLARHFWSQLGGDPAGLTQALLQRWEAYDWPGNIRELRNAVARQLALGDAPLRPSLPPPADHDAIGALLERRLALPIARRKLREEFERRYVELMLADHGGNVSKAAAASGIARRYFQQVRARSSKA
jgi:DNA-binding NtrC family response regulator